MKIYTRKGDQGFTSLFGGKKIPKNHIRVEAYGTVDELNASIGLLRDNIQNAKSRKILYKFQNQLFNIGSVLASDSKLAKSLKSVTEKDILFIEEEIDRLNAVLEPLKNFIIPGGAVPVSLCHQARCICRRAERRVVTLAMEEEVEAEIIKYLNRFSDYLFILSRYIAKDLGVPEIKWRQE